VNRLDALLSPRHVVIIGASTDPTKLGAVMAASLQSFDGHVALVNPRGGEGFHADVQSASAASPGPLDLAIVCVPASACAAAIRECAAVGIGAALVCAGGFAEVGEQGAAIQEELTVAAREGGVRLLGPNTSGFFVPRTGLTASFVPGVADIDEGCIGLVAASGGLNHALAFALQRAGTGLSLGIGIGAGIDVDSSDAVEHLTLDPHTTAIALHIETVSEGQRLLAAVRAATTVKPVVALVVGQHDVGDFAASHTGALATSWRTTRALLRQAGAVIVDDEQELIVAVSTLSVTRLDPSADPGVALVTGQAGPGLVIADTLQDRAVRLPTLESQTQMRLAQLLPPLTYQQNPVDTGRPGATYGDVVAATAADPQVELLAVYGITEPVLDLPAVVAATDRSGVPVVIGIDGPLREVELGRATATRVGLPIAIGATPLAQAVAAVVNDSRGQHLRAGSVPAAHDGARIDAGLWDEAGAKDLLDTLGIATPRRRRCTTPEDVLASVDELNGPLVLKICDPLVLHKSDVGGVQVGLRDRAEVAAALTSMVELGNGPWLVEETSSAGPELVVGARRDPVFGPVVVVGIGGTSTEVYGDVAILSVPATPRQLASMTRDLIGRALVEGHRGSASADPVAVGDVARALGDILCANDHVVELEINPLRITAQGLVALDAVIITTSTSPASERQGIR